MVEATTAVYATVGAMLATLLVLSRMRRGTPPPPSPPPVSGNPPQDSFSLAYLAAQAGNYMEALRQMEKQLESTIPRISTDGTRELAALAAASRRRLRRRWRRRRMTQVEFLRWAERYRALVRGLGR